MAVTISHILFSAAFCTVHSDSFLPFTLPKLPLSDTGIVQGAVKKLPNVFGVAKYFPDVGQEQLAKIVVKNLIEALLSRPDTVLPDKINLPKIDLHIPNFGRLMVDQGEILGLCSYSYDPLELSTAMDGNMEITVRLHFTNLRVVYNQLLVEPWGFKFNENGKVSLKFKSNLLVTKIAVVRYFEVFDKYIKNECICFLTSISITDLGDVEVQFYINGTPSNKIQNRLLSNSLWYLKDAVSSKLNYALVTYAYDTLVSDGYWLCKDERLRTFVLHIDGKQLAENKLVEQKKEESWGNWMKKLF